ncbi:tetratricopeptide repeat protein [Rheinheimera baltica]|uniref:tetratricopeptide repeat protein n=2 Tax=Rheinheimera baltica TaxID=67576 RepID=UPI00273EB3BD|nr:tetratricopeptide repeat protein [Rheinheimera baltica]MDP5151623.1 tetratricopeptide repeat protein [Rheinheimera baltica]
MRYFNLARQPKLSTLKLPFALLILSYLTACSQLLPVAPATSPEVASSRPVEPAPATGLLPLSAVQQQQFDLAKQQLNQGEFVAAIPQLQQLASALPSLPGIGYNLAIAQWRSGDIDAAQQTLRQVVSVAAQYSDAHNLLGVLARQQGHFRLAEQHFQQALVPDNRYAVAHKNLAFLYELYLGQLVKAKDHYQQYYALTNDQQAVGWIALLEQQLAQEQARD